MQNFQEAKNHMFSRARSKPVDERFRTRALGGTPPAIIRFVIDDDVHTFDFTQDEPADTNAEPNLTIRCSWQDFRKIWTGKTPALEAIRLGVLEVEGSGRLGHALQHYFQLDA
jgi:putative sterol carrier protein